MLAILSNPPTDAGPLAFVALIPMLWALRDARPGRGALVGFLFGLVYYGLLLSWLLIFGVLAWAPLAASQAAFLAAFGAIVPLVWRRGRPLRSSLTIAALWTAIDYIRGLWPLGGFTWGGLGYTQHSNGLLLPLASVAGVWGITFVVVLGNALLLEAAGRVRGGWRGRRAAAALIGTGLLAALAPALIPLPAADGPHLTVAVVQGNVPRALASDRLLQSDAVATNHIRLNLRLVGTHPGLVIWPENALAGDPTVDRALGERVSASIRAVGAPTIVGAIADRPGGRYENEALLYDPRGRVAARYSKTHLVPFGEYIPYPSVFGWTQRYRRGLADLSPGRRLTLFDVGGVRVATPICFENTFPNLVRRFVARGANLVVVTTNDSSYLESPASQEHVDMSQLRAVENGRWIVQAAISGESAVIDPRGRIVARTGLFVPAILRASVGTSDARTLYNRLGDWLPWACLVVVALALGAAVLRRGTRRGGRQTPPAGERGGDAPAPIAGGADPRVLVILPTYKERETIERAVTGALAAGGTVDVLVVDDNSPDGTAGVVQRLAAQARGRVRLLRRPGKLGLASAYLEGFRIGLDDGYDVLVEMDADLSHRPADLPRVIAGSNEFDLTVGSRYVPGGGVSNWSRQRLAISRAGNLYARALLHLPVADATSGFRAFRRALAAELVAQGVASDGYAFQIELVHRAVRGGWRVGEVPITFQEREHGHSKFSRRIVVEALWKVTRWGLAERWAGLRRLPRTRRPAPPDSR